MNNDSNTNPEKILTSIGNRFLSMFMMCSSSKAFREKYRKHPREFLTTGYYDDEIQFPGCGMEIPDSAKVYPSSSANWPYIFVFDRGYIDTFPDSKKNEHSYVEVMALLPLDVKEALGEVAFDSYRNGGKIDEIKKEISNMHHLVLAVLEGSEFAITVTRKGKKGRWGGFKGTMIFERFGGKWKGNKVHGLEELPEAYDIIVMVPDWTDTFDELTVVPFKGKEKITLSTC